MRKSGFGRKMERENERDVDRKMDGQRVSEVETIRERG